MRTPWLCWRSESRTRCVPPGSPRSRVTRSDWRSWGRCASWMRWPISASPVCIDHSSRSPTSRPRYRRCGASRSSRRRRRGRQPRPRPGVQAGTFQTRAAGLVGVVVGNREADKGAVGTQDRKDWNGMAEKAATSKRAVAQTGGLRIDRVYTRDGIHPYDEVTWERRDVVMTNWRDGTVNFEQRGVEFPDSWSVNAANIVTTKYFRGAVGTPQREWSLKQLVDRVVGKYVAAGRENGYFATPRDAEIFDHELTYALIHQIFAFNSPVWFNVGTSSPQQVSACQPHDALVSTPAGLVPIGRLVESNAIGAKVYDAHGLTRIVATKSNGVKDVLRLHTKDGYTLDVTADHLVWRAADLVNGAFVTAGTLRVADALLQVEPEVGGSDRQVL